MSKEIKAAAQALRTYTVDLRRRFHMHPEPAMCEFQTAAAIREELDAIGIPYEIVAQTGVVATIQGAFPGSVVALRGDIDGLELEDQKDVPYRSQAPGLAHACGHDGHTAMLLTAARILNAIKQELHGTVKLIFQPGEESIIGARTMMEESAFMDDVDGIFGIHLMVTAPTGTLLYREGPFASSADGFRIEIKGLGGHGSTPHLAVDAGLVAGAILVNAQSLVSREISPMEPGVISFGVVKAGSRYNIIPDDALLEGTIRSYDPAVRETLCSGLIRMAEGIAASYNASAKLVFISSVAPLINDPAHTQLYRQAAEKVVGKDHVIQTDPMTGSDDFAEFLAKTPGVYANVGCRNEAKGIVHFHHHPQFDIDEDALPIGSALYAQYAVDFLNSKPK